MSLLLKFYIFSSRKQIIAVELVLTCNILDMLRWTLLCCVIIFVLLYNSFDLVSLRSRLLLFVLLFFSILYNFCWLFRVSRQIWRRHPHFLIWLCQSVELGIECSSEISMCPLYMIMVGSCRDIGRRFGLYDLFNNIIRPTLHNKLFLSSFFHLTWR